MLFNNDINVIHVYFSTFGNQNLFMYSFMFEDEFHVFNFKLYNLSVFSDFTLHFRLYG